MKKTQDELFDEPILDDDCPCCRMMRDEWGVIEEAPLQHLLERGMVLPSADTLSAEDLRNKVLEIIFTLGELRIFVEHTDHLDDRTLYDLLCSDVLARPILFSPGDTCSASHVSMTDCGSPDNDDWLRYYADEDDRRQWLERWPDYPMPPHVDPPFGRDALLPRPYDSPEVAS